MLVVYLMKYLIPMKMVTIIIPAIIPVIDIVSSVTSHYVSPFSTAEISCLLEKMHRSNIISQE
jgi:hypothetical protein